MGCERMRWLLVVLLTVACTAAAEPSLTVEATGVAQAGADAGKARDEALADAQRLAVEQAAGVFVSAETEVHELQLLHDEIRTKTRGFLASYEILSTRQEGEIVKVTIRATVRLSALAADLLDLPALVSRLNRPKLMVLFDETVDGQPAETQVTTNEAQKALVQRGFDVVDTARLARPMPPDQLAKVRQADTATLLALATEQGIDVVLMGRCEVHRLAEAVPGTFSYGGHLEVKAIATQTGELLAAQSLEAGASPARPGAAAFDAPAAALLCQRRLAAAAIVGDAARTDPDGLISQMIAKWLRSDTVLTLQVGHVRPAQCQPLSDALHGLRLVRELNPRSYDQEVMTVELRGTAPLPLLLEALAGLAVGDAKLAVIGWRASVATAELR